MKDKLTLKQKLFCDYYLESNRNATDAVIKAGYDVKLKNGKPDRMTARNIASENLAKLGIKNYIRQKLEAHELSSENVMRQHAYLINQFNDLSVKAKAIDMYYKKTGAYTSDKNDEKSNRNLEGFMDRLAKMFPD